jgi:hypothetical protein
MNQRKHTAGIVKCWLECTICHTRKLPFRKMPLRVRNTPRLYRIVWIACWLVYIISISSIIYVSSATESSEPTISIAIASNIVPFFYVYMMILSLESLHYSTRCSKEEELNVLKKCKLMMYNAAARRMYTLKILF